MDRQRLLELAGVTEMRHDTDIQYPEYGGGHEHDQDEYHMWEFVEQTVLSGEAERDPERFFAAIRQMIDKRSETQM